MEGGVVLQSDSPILILSCYRTGSTLLRFILDTHPRIYSPPEVFLGQAAQDLASLAIGLRGLGGGKDPLDAIDPDVLSWVRTILDGELRAAAERKGKSIWCEKTPSNLIPQNLRVLEQVFPDARRICLHRHCLDVVQSLLKMVDRLTELQPYLLQGGVVTAAINYWNDRTATLLQHEQDHPSQCFRLRYEDMVTEPVKTLEPMFRFLGLDWDESLITGVFAAQHDRGLDDHYIFFTSSIHSQSLGVGRSVSLKGVPEKTLNTMHSLLDRLGYPHLPAAPSAGSAGAKTTVPRDLRWFFETHLPARIREEPGLCAEIARSYQFFVTGDERGAWVLDPRKGRIAAGEAAAACTIEVSAADLFAIAHGELHPWKATEQRRLRLAGDAQPRELEKLMRLLHLPKEGNSLPS
jgi:protein-tyrosine sulfotransferase